MAWIYLGLRHAEAPVWPATDGTRNARSDAPGRLSVDGNHPIAPNIRQAFRIGHWSDELLMHRQALRPDHYGTLSLRDRRSM